MKRKKIILLLIVVLAFAYNNGKTQVTLIASNVSAEPGQVVDIPVKVTGFNEIIGMQFSINWDNAIVNLKEVHSLSTDLPSFNEEDLGMAGTPQGNLRVAWIDNSINGVTLTDSASLFILKYEIIGDKGSESIITFSNEPIAIEFIDSSSTQLTVSVEEGEVVVPQDQTTSINPIIIPRSISLYQNQPNPFNNYTDIPIVFQEKDWVRFEISDALGRQVYQKEFEALPGSEFIRIQRSDLNHNGIYYYTIKTKQYRLSKKMILMH